MWILFGGINLTKKINLIGLIISIMIMLDACAYPSAYKWKISNQLNTKWISEDGTIVFSVNDNHLVTGTIDVNGKVMEIYIVTEPEAGTGMHIYPISVLEYESKSEEDKYEYWICSYETEKEFIATVRKTTFYGVGQKITFHKVSQEE